MGKPSIRSWLVIAMFLPGCREPAARAEVHRRRVVVDKADDWQRRFDQAHRERIARQTERAHIVAEKERKTREIQERFEALHSAMYEFGLARLSHLADQERPRAIYHRHLRGIARILVDSVDPDHPLLSKEDDPYLLAAIAYHESSWTQAVMDGRRRGARGEVGMFQLMPDGYCALSARDERGRRFDLLDARQNARAAVACLGKIRARYEARSVQGHDIWYWLASYASGKDWPVGREAVEGPNGFRAFYQELRERGGQR